MAQDPPSSMSGVEPGGAQDESTRGAPPGWARWVSRISFVVAIVALIATIWATGPMTILGHLRAIGWWFAAIVAFEVVITAFDAAAIHALASDRDGRTTYGRVLFAQIAGRAVNATTPGGTLGEATKASVLTGSMSTSRAVSAVVYVGLASSVIQLVAIAIGAPLTALALALPPVLETLLYVTGGLAAVIAVGLALLVRRGMLVSIAAAAARLHLISGRRQARWNQKLGAIDDRLRGARGQRGRHHAIAYVLISKLLTWTSVWVTLAAAGYMASVGEIAALLSAGIVLGWIAHLVPLGLGVSETGNYALFNALGAPPAYGVALALARRINQLVYAAIGFALLATWRVSSRARRRLHARTRHPERKESSMPRSMFAALLLSASLAGVAVPASAATPDRVAQAEKTTVKADAPDVKADVGDADREVVGSSDRTFLVIGLSTAAVLGLLLLVVLLARSGSTAPTTEVHHHHT